MAASYSTRIIERNDSTYRLPSVTSLILDDKRLVYVGRTMTIEQEPPSQTYLISNVNFKPGPLLKMKFHEIFPTFGPPTIEDLTMDTHQLTRGFRLLGSAWKFRCNYRYNNVYTGQILVFGSAIRPFLFQDSWHVLYSTVFPGIFGRRLTDMFYADSPLWKSKYGEHYV